MSDSFYTFLRGKWRVKRKIFNSNKEPQGFLIGEAKCTPSENNALCFSEELEGVFDTHCGKSWHKLELTFESHTRATLFQRGELFHHLEFDKPFTLIHHKCKEDQYLGLYTFHKKKRLFSVTWRVKGPKKNYFIQAYYEKVA